MTAYGYLRKSSIRDATTDHSAETQEREVRTLAARHGHDNGSLVILSDMDISGQGKYTKRRIGYLTLCEAVKSGQATAVYSYSLSRLARSVAELNRFFELCAEQRVPVRLVADAVDTATASGRLTMNVLASVAQFEAEVASERVKATNAARVARGESIGGAPAFGEMDGEDVAAILEAFHRTGSFRAAAVALNAAGLKPRRSRSGIWWPSSVAGIVRRAEPGIRSGGRGVKHGYDFALARLLVCGACGTRLSGYMDRSRSRTETRYICAQSSVVPHARRSISGHLILPAIRDEVAHLVTPRQVRSAQDASQRAKLEERRTRILDMFESGNIDRGEKERRLAAMTDAIALLDERQVVQAVPSIDWDWSPRELNHVLRALFERIELDPATFQPIGFTWRVPEWRR